ncbi:MAG TPA: hypothetical protein VGB57_01410 [Allosphingosinicella sp.]|jgi:hypothetical protein
MTENEDKIGGRGGGGDSGGGAYPNPHSGKDGDRGGFMDHGGQTEMPYHGSGRLGDEKTGDNPNVPTGKAKPGDKGTSGSRE